MMIDLTEDEMQIIVERWAAEAAARKMEEYRLHVAETAVRFFRYLSEAGMAPSFSEFVNNFGYQERDGRMVYEYVLALRQVLWK